MGNSTSTFQINCFKLIVKVIHVFVDDGLKIMLCKDVRHLLAVVIDHCFEFANFFSVLEQEFRLHNFRNIQFNPVDFDVELNFSVMSLLVEVLNEGD